MVPKLMLFYLKRRDKALQEICNRTRTALGSNTTTALPIDVIKDLASTGQASLTKLYNKIDLNTVQTP
jgi:hypothetical protein